MDCLMSFPDFLYAFQTQFFYEGKVDVLGILNFKKLCTFFNGQVI